MQGRNYGPQVTVRRLAVRTRRPTPIFSQLVEQVVKMRPAELRLPSRAWKVTSKFNLAHWNDAPYLMAVDKFGISSFFSILGDIGRRRCR